VAMTKKKNKLKAARARKKGNCSTPSVSRTMRGGSTMNAFSSKTHFTDTVSDLDLDFLLFNYFSIPSRFVFNDIGVMVLCF
jgi:hypothetical protein